MSLRRLVRRLRRIDPPIARLDEEPRCGEVLGDQVLQEEEVHVASEPVLDPRMNPRAPLIVIF